MEVATTKLVGWHRKRNEQYVLEVHLYCMPGSPEILLGTATCFEYSRSYFSCNIRCDHDVIDTYLSLRYICYNYCDPVYIKLNFEALQVLRQCESFRSKSGYTCHISYQLIIMEFKG